jgi:hypothetical protein
MEEIRASIAEEQRVTEGLTWKEFLLPINRWRLFLVITLQIGMSPFHVLICVIGTNLRSRCPTYGKYFSCIL